MFRGPEEYSQSQFSSAQQRALSDEISKQLLGALHTKNFAQYPYSKTVKMNNLIRRIIAQQFKENVADEERLKEANLKTRAIRDEIESARKKHGYDLQKGLGESRLEGWEAADKIFSSAANIEDANNKAIQWLRDNPSPEKTEAFTQEYIKRMLESDPKENTYKDIKNGFFFGLENPVSASDQIIRANKTSASNIYGVGRGKDVKIYKEAASIAKNKTPEELWAWLNENSNIPDKQHMISIVRDIYKKKQNEQDIAKYKEEDLKKALDEEEKLGEAVLDNYIKTAEFKNNAKAEELELGAEALAKNINKDYAYAQNPQLKNLIDRENELAMEHFNKKILPSLEAQFVRAGQHGSASHRDMATRATQNMGRTLADRTSQLLSEDYYKGMAHHNDQARNAAVGATLLRDVATAKREHEAQDMARRTEMGNYLQSYRQQHADSARQDWLASKEAPFENLSKVSAIAAGQHAPMNTLTQYAHVQQPVPRLNTTGQLASALTSLGNLWGSLGSNHGKGRFYKRGGLVKKRIDALFNPIKRIEQELVQNFSKGGLVTAMGINRHINNLWKD